MRNLFLSLIVLLLGLLVFDFVSPATAAAASGAELPNILWLTSEDNSFQWLGCYGNEQASTPRLDALAAESVQFDCAYSNAPVCAVARSTILFGSYAVSMGTQNMRSRYSIPQKFKPYVRYLKSLGYYCTNNSKTDYNRKGKDGRIWDACSNRAHYKNRPEGSPFFAIFNSTISHESSLFPQKVADYRKRGIIPQETRLNPADIETPPYLPDIPEVRNDLAIYYDTMTALDKQMGAYLDELKLHGLAEDTIVFYYADHGGPTPRGKRYLADTGVRVPLLVHFPKKWQHLSPFAPGERVDELVAFVDFAPTLLSLCGLEKPPQMQGRAFLGDHREEPAENADIFLFGDRFDELTGMRRGITDGHFKYIRCFTPHLPAAPYSYYSLGMPSWQGWQKAWQEGRLSEEFNALWEKPQPVERLFDLSADPWEIHNLADNPEYADQLQSMRSRLKEKMVATRDTGLICEALFPSLAGKQTIHEYARSRKFDAQRTTDLAFLASDSDPQNLPALIAATQEADPVLRYWSALGCLILGESAEGATDRLTALLSDSEPAIRVVAAHALHGVGQTEQATAALLRELDKNTSNQAALQLVQAITQIDAADKVPGAWVQRTLKEAKVSEYLKRFAKRLNEQGK